MSEASSKQTSNHRSVTRTGKKNVFKNRTLEPYSVNGARRPLMEKFKPPLPERLLPTDPHPNYRPLFMSEQDSVIALPYVENRIESPLPHNSQASRSPSGYSNGESSVKNGAKCPHCSKGLVYAYNLSKHIENRHNIPTGLYHCRLCTFKATTDFELRSHREARHRRCPYCNIRFDTERGMNRHIYDCPNRPKCQRGLK